MAEEQPSVMVVKMITFRVMDRLREATSEKNTCMTIITTIFMVTATTVTTTWMATTTV